MWNKVWCFCNELSLTMIQTFRVWRRQSEAERTVQMNKIHSDTWVSLTAVRYRNCMNTKCVCITVLEGIENVAAPFELSSSVMYDAFRCFLWMCCWQRCSTEQTERSSLNIYSLRQNVWMFKMWIRLILMCERQHRSVWLHLTSSPCVTDFPGHQNVSLCAQLTFSRQVWFYRSQRLHSKWQNFV